MWSDIHGIEIQLLKPSDIYSWIVIFGHKRPKEPNRRLNTYTHKTNIYERHPLLLPSKLIVRLGKPWTCDFLVYGDQCSTK